MEKFIYGLMHAWLYHKSMWLMIRISQKFIVEVFHIQFQHSLQWFYGIYRKPLLWSTLNKLYYETTQLKIWNWLTIFSEFFPTNQISEILQEAWKCMCAVCCSIERTHSFHTLKIMWTVSFCARLTGQPTVKYMTLSTMSTRTQKCQLYPHSVKDKHSWGVQMKRYEDTQWWRVL